MYTENDSTPFGMRFGSEFTGKWNVPAMWDRLYTDLDVEGRRATAAEFNRMNKWVKRGGERLMTFNRFLSFLLEFFSDIFVFCLSSLLKLVLFLRSLGLHLLQNL